MNASEQIVMERLLKISQAIATIRNRKELFSTLPEHIQPVIPVNDTGILVLDPTGQRWQVWTNVNNEHETIACHASPQAGNDQWMSIAPETQYILDHSGIMTVAELTREYPEHPFGPIMHEAGLREFIFSSLMYKGHTVGVLFLGAEKEGTYTSYHLETSKSLADLIAVAVANIRALEEILQRDREKASLLCISEAITRINNRQALLRVIYDIIQPIFPFDNAGLFVTDQEKDCLYEILDRDSSDDQLQDKPTAKDLLGHWPLSIFHPDNWWMQHQTVIRSLEEEAQLTKQFYSGETQFDVGLSFGLKQFIGGPLFANGKKIGAICFNSKQEDFYSAAHLPLFKGISEQVAIALSNILAQEDIMQREREKEAVLAITAALSLVRSRAELVDVLTEKAQRLLGFTEAPLLLLLSEDGQWLNYFYNPTLEQLKDHPVFAPLYPRVPNAGVFREVFQEKKAFIRDRYYFTQKAGEMPINGALAVAVEATGLDQVMVGLLQSRGKVYGSLHLHSHMACRFTRQQLPLFQAITDQVAIALDNLLANEEILRRDREKTLLLQISERIARVHNKAELISAVVDQINSLLGSNDCRILLIGDARQANQVGLLEEIAPFSEDTDFKGTKDIVLPDSLLAAVVARIEESGAPILVDYAEIFSAYPDRHLLGAFLNKSGYRQAVVSLLKTGGQLLGVFVANYLQEQDSQRLPLPLIQTVTDQLSVAMSNILANEHLIQKARQIQQHQEEVALQLSLNNALVTLKDPSALFSTIAQELNRLVVLDLLCVRVLKGGRLIHYAILTKDKARFLETTGQLKEYCPNLEELEAKELWQQHVRPAVYISEAFEHLCKQSGIYLAWREHMGIQSCLELVLPSQKDLRAILRLGSRSAYGFMEADLNRLQLVTSQITLAIENLSAFAELADLKEQVEQEKTYLVEEIKTTYNFDEIIGSSSLLTDVFQRVSQVAAADTTVLITGESGTGKELIARALHSRSLRREKILVKINCAALPASLIESELFGHEKGAFTGAVSKRVGKFELANGGTIFLDEIGELPLDLQAKLLRVLQEREYERLGANKLYKTDVRVIAATNRNLLEEVDAGRFRLDLFYRLCVFPIHLPSLRERGDDIPVLAHYFASKYCKKMGKSFRGLSEQTIRELRSHHWPGNIRELENAMEQAAILHNGPGVLNWIRPATARPPLTLNALPILAAKEEGADAKELLTQTLGSIREASQAAEREQILAVLRQTGGRIRGENGAAQLLGLKPTTLEARMVKLGIKK